jgi:hypothetical protein
VFTLQKPNYLHLKEAEINYFPDPNLKLIATNARRLEKKKEPYGIVLKQFSTSQTVNIN